MVSTLRASDPSVYHMSPDLMGQNPYSIVDMIMGGGPDMMTSMVTRDVSM